MSLFLTVTGNGFWIDVLNDFALKPFLTLESGVPLAMKDLSGTYTLAFCVSVPFGAYALASSR